MHSTMKFHFFPYQSFICYAVQWSKYFQIPCVVFSLPHPLPLPPEMSLWVTHAGDTCKFHPCDEITSNTWFGCGPIQDKSIKVYTNISFISLLPLIKQNLQGFKLTRNPAKVTNPRGESGMRVHATSCDPSLKLHLPSGKKWWPSLSSFVFPLMYA